MIYGIYPANMNNSVKKKNPNIVARNVFTKQRNEIVVDITN